jgi:hypothetical protein
MDFWSQQVRVFYYLIKLGNILRVKVMIGYLGL